MADIKSLLKDARKLIDDKSYKDAQECCKNILRKDKQNYFALVLLGKSLQDSDQAPLAYQKAISSKPDHPLAWHGLANYYERKESEADKEKLLSIYCEMFNLQMEEDKAIEIIIKLGHLGCSLKSNKCLSTLAKYLNKDAQEKKLYKVAERQFLDLLKTDVLCKEEDLPLILKSLNRIYTEEPSVSLELQQAKVIMQKSDFLSAFKEILNLDFFSSNVILREWFCKKLCMKYVEQMSFCNIEIDKYIDAIGEGIMNSKYPSLLRSMICYDRGLYFEAYKQCVPLVNYHDADMTEAKFIVKCSIMLKKWPITQKLATNFLTKVKENNFSITLKRFLFLSLYKQQKWTKAIYTLKDISPDCLDRNELVNLAVCLIESNQSAEHIVDDLKGTDSYKQLQALLLLKQENFQDVIGLLEGMVENALDAFYLGKAYWELKQYDKCLINLLKAAKLDPDYCDTFLYLGHFYHLHKSDLEKAKKCFEKAYNLNPISSNIAKSLSEVYIKLHQKETDFELLNKLSKNLSTNETWISFRLGLHYLNRREWENAILNFRNVIKINHNDTTAFECLADAYYSRGSFTSALRAYNRVMTLDPNKSAHCLTRTGYIYSLLTQYQEAISTFEKVFQIEPYSFLALKGIAETWMRIAKKKSMAKLYGSARDCVQYAIDYILKSLMKQKQFSCFWKLLADNLIFITGLPDKYAYVSMPNLSKDNDSEITKKEKLEIFPQAIACYSFIAKQNGKITTYDLASTYLSFYHESKNVVNCNIAFNLTINCIKERPTLWRNWNLLGRICLNVKKYEIAQHCFIKALLVTRKWSVARIWCNLGTLYLKLKLYKLANYCFWRGQSMLPSYPQSWIGQGLIAETVRQEEAMDLFRHASRLGYHPESALGYADWVLRTLKDDKYKRDPESKYVIDGLYAVPYAIDLVEWFCNFNPHNACAYNILGILQERYGLLSSCLQSYEKAFKYADDEKKNIILLNIGRALLRIGKYEEAIKIYKAITEASFSSTTGLALALFKKGLYEEAYSVYDTALHWLSNEDDEKAELLVAMAGIVYKYKGVDDAKTLLFHSIQISQKKPTANSLFAICSLGLIHSDQSLSKLALSELKKYENEIDYGYDIGFLKSYLSVLEGNIGQAIKILSDSLHDHPSVSSLWFCMAQYCLQDSDTKAKVASCCAQKALCSAHYEDNNCNAGKILASASIAEYIAGNKTKALLVASDGLHKYPTQGEIWAALLFTLLPQKTWIEKKSWLLGTTAHVRKNLKITRTLGRWLILMEKKLTK